MRIFKLRKAWIALVIAAGLAALVGCNGGGLSVGYSPAVVCGSHDFDPVECRR